MRINYIVTDQKQSDSCLSFQTIPTTHCVLEYMQVSDGQAVRQNTTAVFRFTAILQTVNASGIPTASPTNPPGVFDPPVVDLVAITHQNLKVEEAGVRLKSKIMTVEAR